MDKNFDPPLDLGIECAVRLLINAGIETFESCEVGPGNSNPEPTVAFHGGKEEGFRAMVMLCKMACLCQR